MNKSAVHQPSVNWINPTNRVLWLRYTRSTRSKRKKPATSRRKGNRRGGRGETAREKSRGGGRGEEGIREGGKEGRRRRRGVRRMLEKNGVTERSMAGGLFTMVQSIFRAPPPSQPPAVILFLPFLFVSFLHTYFSLAWESEGTDDPFPFAYIVAVVAAGQFFQRKYKCAVVAPLHSTNEKERKIAGTSRVRVVRPYMYARLWSVASISLDREIATVVPFNSTPLLPKTRRVSQTKCDIYIKANKMHTHFGTRSLSVSFPVSVSFLFVCSGKESR